MLLIFFVVIFGIKTNYLGNLAWSSTWLNHNQCYQIFSALWKNKINFWHSLEMVNLLNFLITFLKREFVKFCGSQICQNHYLSNLSVLVFKLEIQILPKLKKTQFSLQNYLVLEHCKFQNNRLATLKLIQNFNQARVRR